MTPPRLPPTPIGKQVVVISSSSVSGSVNTKFRTTTVPVVTWEPGLFDDLGMTALGTSEVTGQQNLAIVAPGHPLAAGLSGTIAVTSVTSPFAAGSPNANATIVARIPGATTASLFAYELGATMPGLVAPARRVALFMSDNTAAVFNASGTALFNAAIGWAVGGGGPEPNAHAEPDSDAHAEPDSDAHAEPDSDAHAEPDSDAHAEPDSDAHARPRTPTPRPRRPRPRRPRRPRLRRPRRARLRAPRPRPRRARAPAPRRRSWWSATPRPWGPAIRLSERDSWRSATP